MAQAAQNDPYARYGGSVADDSGIEQPIASVRTAANSNVGDSFQMNGQDVYVSGVDANGRKTLSVGKPPAGNDPYAQYGGKIAQPSAAPSADPYAKYNQPQGMTRPEADKFFENLATQGHGTYQPPKQPSFADTALVDPNSPVFGEQIKISVHPDSRGGRNLVPIQDVAAVRRQMQFNAANPEIAARVDRSQQMDTSLPFAERLAARQGLQARTRTEFGQRVSNVNDQYLNFVGNQGADKGEALVNFLANHFQDDGKATPGEIGVARSVGKNVARTVADPVSQATIITGGMGGKLGQATVAGLFSAGAAKQSYDAAGQLGSIWDRPDISRQQKTEMATDLFLNTAMAGMAGAHAVKVPFIKNGDPLLSSIPQEYRDAVAQRINSTLSKTGGIISRAAGTAGDVMAEIANSDRENVPTQGVQTLRRSVPKIPASSANIALPLVKAVADDAGLKTVTAEDLLNSTDENTGAVSSGLIGEAKKSVIAEAGQAAGPGRTIADLSQREAQPYIQKLDALDELHDHIEAAQAKETEDLKAAANKGKIPQNSAEALAKMATGGGKYAFAKTIAAHIPFGGPLTRAAFNAAGISSGFGDLAAGVKYFIGKGGKASPTLDVNLNNALGRTIAGDVTPYEPNETREPAPQYQGDTSVQHQYVTVPPETPHGEAPLLRDVPNPRFQLTSSTTADPYARYGGKVAEQSANVGSTNAQGSFTSVPHGVIPEQTPQQLPLPKEQPQGSKTSDVVRVGISPREQAFYDAQAAANKSPSAADVAKERFIAQRAPQPERTAADVARERFIAAQGASTGDIFPNDKAMEDWLNNQYERSPRIQKIKDLVRERIQQGDLPPGIRPSPDELARMNSQIHNMIYEANAQGVDTPAQLDRIDQWIRATNKQPKPFQPGQPLKTRPAPTQTNLEPQPQGYQGPERRQAMDYRAQVAAMEPQDQAKAIFFSEKTGLPNYRAFQQSAQILGDTHPIVGYADVDDFKSANTALGHQSVDTKILPMIGDLFKEAAQSEDGVHVFHRSGDEFLFRANDPAAVTRVVNRVNEQLHGAKFTAQKADGSIVEHTGTGLSHGTGATEDAAELAAEDSKQQRQLQGLRKGRAAAATAPVQEANTQPTVFQGSRTGSAAAEGNTSQRSNLLVRPAASLKPGDSSLVPTADLKTDPSRFQYKGGTNEEGVTNALKDQNKYDPNKGGVLLVWKDPANGFTYVINGHHRFELAQRAGEPNVLVRAIDAADAEEAKVIGAETNISEGHGSIVDAARYFKAARITTPQDAMNRNLPMGQAKVKDGLAMARLDNSILDNVESGRIPEGRAVAIGSVTDNPAQQEAVLQAIAKAEKRSGRDLNNGEVESIARQVKASASHVQQGQDLFGMFNREQSLYGEQAAIDDYVLKQLAGDKRTFGAVSTAKRAEALGTVEGQKINAAENQRISEQAAQASEIYKKLVNSPGALNDIRTNAAKSLAGKMSNPNAVKAHAYARIRQELLGHLGDSGADAKEGQRP